LDEETRVHVKWVIGGETNWKACRWMDTERYNVQNLTVVIIF
jgi:hypothetical protein